MRTDERPKEYSCGLEAALEVVGGKWKVLILWGLRQTPRRFGALRREIPGISEKMLIQHLKEMESDGIVTRKDYKVGLNVTETAVDDPDPALYENYVCGAQRNYTGYCNPEIDKLIDRQSNESDIEKRKRLVWEIERKLAEDGARPIIFYAPAGNCRQPLINRLKSRLAVGPTSTVVVVMSFAVEDWNR